jgi:hypothetical protein
VIWCCPMPRIMQAQRCKFPVNFSTKKAAELRNLSVSIEGKSQHLAAASRNSLKFSGLGEKRETKFKRNASENAKLLQLINPKISLIQKFALIFHGISSVLPFVAETCRYVPYFSSASSFLQQQSARYFSPHERNNASPTATGNLTVLNSPQCYPPPNENLLNRPSCLTCPTIGEHCDHPTASTIPPHPSHFHPFHNMHGPPPLHKNLMTNQHAIYDSCQR